MTKYEDEVELTDYLNVIWKRKWLIIIPTLFCILVAGVISFFLPREWEIETVIMPSNFLIRTEQGRFKGTPAVEIEQIVQQIRQGFYKDLIVAELNLDSKEFPKLMVRMLDESDVLRISTREKDVEKAKQILSSLFTHLKRELDKKAKAKMESINAKIKSKQSEKKRLEETIDILRNKFNLVRKRIKEISKKMNSIKNRFEQLEREKENETESLALLVFSNEILQNQIYFNILNEWRTSKKTEEQTLYLKIDNERRKIEKLENQIDKLNERRENISLTRMIKEPTSSPSPVTPNKTINILIAGILGLMVFTAIAFLLEKVERQKVKGQKNKSP